MRQIVKEKRNDIQGYYYKFPTISKIQNNTYRRFALIATFPLFFTLNCLAVMPFAVVGCIFNNKHLVETVIKRWIEPLSKETNS